MLQKVRSKEIELRKVHGEANPADLLTKHLDRGRLDNFCKMLGYEAMEGVGMLTL